MKKIILGLIVVAVVMVVGSLHASFALAANSGPGGAVDPGLRDPYGSSTASSTNPCDYYHCAPIDPCSYSSCYPYHDNAEYGNANNNNNDNSNVNTNINQNDIWINIYANGSITGSNIDVRSLPTCNNGLDDDNDGRVDYNDTDCRAYDRENGRNTQLNTTAPVFATFAPTAARVGVVYVYDADARDNDGDVLDYRLTQNPAGMTIDTVNGIVRWTPTAAQAGQAYGVSIMASDGVHQTSQTFQIFVENAPRPVAVATRPATSTASTGRVAGASIGVAQAAEQGSLRAFNIRVDTDADQNSIISWDTTKPSHGRVIYGLATRGDHTGTDFTGANQYEFSTPDSLDISTSHQVNLGKLESERVYYFRVVAFAGTELSVSSERGFVQLGNGDTLTNEAGFASVFSTLGSFLISPWFLLLVVILLALMIFFRRRNQSEIIAHDLPVELHNEGHH